MDCKKSGTEIEISERVETSEWSQHSRIRPSELDLSAFLDLTWSSSIAFSSTTPRLIWPGLWRSLCVRAPGLFVVGLHVPNEDLGDSKEGLTIRDLPERVFFLWNVWFFLTLTNFQCQTLRTELCTSSNTKMHESYRNLTNLKTFMKNGKWLEVWSNLPQSKLFVSKWVELAKLANCEFLIRPVAFTVIRRFLFTGIAFPCKNLLNPRKCERKGIVA